MPAQLVKAVAPDADIQPGAAIVRASGTRRLAQGHPSRKQPLQQEQEPLEDSSTADEGRSSQSI